MRAAVYQPGGAVRLEERAVPEPGPGEVLEIQAGYSAGPHDTRAALDLIAAGAIPADRLVTHRFPLERTEEALAAARSRAGVKVIVTSSA